MINERTVKFIKRKAQQNKVSFPNNYKSRLQGYYDVAKSFGYKLSFDYSKKNKFYNVYSDILTANAGWSLKNFPILVSPEWAYRLLCCHSDDVENAFLITLGHEMTHKANKDICTCSINIKNSKFKAYINEVHADFNSTHILCNNNRDKLVNALLYKKSSATKLNGNYSHPSWDKRIEYATNYNFNEELIRKIASDVKVTDEKIISIACHHFDEIILK